MEKCTKCGSLNVYEDSVTEVHDFYVPYGNGHGQTEETYRADVCGDCGHYEVHEPNSYEE
jgi:hypothetical protein